MYFKPVVCMMGNRASYLANTITFILSIAVATCKYAQATNSTLDINSADTLRLTQAAAVHNLLLDNPPNSFGAFGIPEFSLWGESALTWHSIIGYLGTANDIPVLDILRKSLNIASFQGLGDFLGGNLAHLEIQMHGKTNDKLVLWGLAVAKGTEVFGSLAQINPAALTFGNLTQRTWMQLQSAWDETLCSGGIPTDTTVPLSQQIKSTITNAGFMALSARLYGITGNVTYKKWADKTYNWMADSGLITTEFSVYESLAHASTINASTSHVVSDPSPLSKPTSVKLACKLYSREQWSAPSGLLLSALGYMYQYTTLEPYIDQLRTLLNATLETFSTSNAVLIEPLCELGAKCVQQAWFKGILVGGLTDTYQTVEDAKIRKLIQTRLEISLSEMVKTCGASWNCSQIWSGVPISPYTLNDQYQTVQLLNSAMIMLQAIDTTNSNSSTTYTSTSTTDYMPSTTTSTLQSTMTLSESSLASWIPIVGANTSQAMHTSRASIWTVSMYMIAVWIIANMIG
ncbi:hypothetical protein BDEG_25285 [Batrachochytrium dendrobatidis JEL423]|uniref:mannan endo-1,6-alpha-mannosidase n=1 Tax=Batrachochytrium dendrobatidis (strain JEL423) TaxID=403673 RepID=A0A177WNR3_BATDL|nr:hypothetical protein BDEG_25285 [Batrachochytrium dendrobatidis JEL423]